MQLILKFVRDLRIHNIFRMASLPFSLLQKASSGLASQFILPLLSNCPSLSLPKRYLANRCLLEPPESLPFEHSSYPSLYPLINSSVWRLGPFSGWLMYLHLDLICQPWSYPDSYRDFNDALAYGIMHYCVSNKKCQGERHNYCLHIHLYKYNNRIGFI